MTLARPAREDDLAAVAELVARANVADVGLRDTSAEEIREEWAAPGFEGWVVPQGDALVGYASLAERSAERAYLDVYVDPPARGRGLETELVRILEARMRERGLSGASAFAVTPEMGSVLEREGFRLTRHHFQMAIELELPPPEPVWPPGVTSRAFVPGSDDEAVWQLVNEAFQGEYGYVAEPFDRWRTRVESEQFEPALWLLAVRGDELVGAVLAFAYPSGGWVETLAVRPGARRLGIGMALLHAAFTAFRRRGATAVALSVDAENPTGATRLYERAGMRVAYRVDRYEKSVGTL